MSEVWVLTCDVQDGEVPGDMLVIGCYTRHGDDGSYPGDESFRAECANYGAMNPRSNGMRGLIADLPEGGFVQLRFAGKPDSIDVAVRATVEGK